MQVTRIGGRRVLFVMATDHEYGRCLAERFVPLMTGVGPVEAAIGTTQALAGTWGCTGSVYGADGAPSPSEVTLNIALDLDEVWLRTDFTVLSGEHQYAFRS